MNVFITGDTHRDFSRIYNFFERVGTTRDDSRLHGKKHLINGNHDSSWINKVDVSKYFKTVELMSVISDGAYAMTLCHYPFLIWKHEKTSYMIHGYNHTNTNMDFWSMIAVRKNLLNAGVDLNGFQPVPFDELLANNIRFKEEH